jgi:2-polyprenyl-3-methyl-5-hydroxy-6-metoxy-1,4-benzoquinol methylase
MSLVCHCCRGKDVFVCCDKNGKHVLHCLDCGVYFFHERPTADELSNHYRGQYSLQHREQLFYMLKDRYNSGYFKNEITSHLHYLNMPAAKVLDYGSSYGFYLRTMKDLGLGAYGIEYDRDIVAYNERELGITMVDPAEVQTLERNSFDIIRAYHTLEHLPDPRGVVSIFHQMLKSNGILLLSSPCLSDSTVYTNVTKIPDMVYPEHLFYFTTKSISALLADIGFRIEINISQFANPSQALAVLGINGNIDLTSLNNIAKGLEGIGAGMNSFAVARKVPPSHSTYVKARVANDVLHIYPLHHNRRGSHHIIKQDGFWEINFQVKRDSCGGRIFVAGNIIVLHADNYIRIKLINALNNSPQPNESEPFKDNEMKSFMFYNDVKDQNDYYIQISGINASEFICYDLNCSEVSFQS